MTNILVSTETERWLTDARDPDDEWSRDSYDGQVVNVWASVLEDWDGEYKYSWSSGSHVKELPEVGVGDTVYAVVADYSTGDTFGRDGGYAQVLEVFTDPTEAEKFAKVASTYTGPEWTKSFEYSFEYEGKEYSRAWAGYFEHLNSLDVWALTVRSNYQSLITSPENKSFGFKVGK